MNIEEMCNQTINLYRQLDSKKQIIWKGNNHLAAVLVSLDIHLGSLAEVCGLDDTKIDGITESSNDLRLEKLIVVIRDFILLSSICNWNDNLSLSEKEEQRLSILTKDNKSQLDVLYLSIKNMLLKAYYQKDEIAFHHAWVLLMKWAKTDLNFTNLDLQTAFKQKIEKDANLI